MRLRSWSGGVVGEVELDVGNGSGGVDLVDGKRRGDEGELVEQLVGGRGGGGDGEWRGDEGVLVKQLVGGRGGSDEGELVEQRVGGRAPAGHHLGDVARGGGRAPAGHHRCCVHTKLIFFVLFIMPVVLPLAARLCATHSQASKHAATYELVLAGRWYKGAT